MKWFWRKRTIDEDDDQKRKDIEQSEERLKQTEDRWPEIHRAERNLDSLIERALRGGNA